MAYVRQIEPGTPEAEADPLLARLYADAIRRAGRVWKIVQVSSLDPRATRASLALYQELMHGAGPLPRRVREALAVVVSQANACGY
ncbi:MAG: carboxymuconolactone decarboxylase family protein [Planctomycetota bacterium]|nr:carboxymuconolactone decarboxylase family protein [Planctomycetota bacterium]